jgi:hypothetical protein
MDESSDEFRASYQRWKTLPQAARAGRSVKSQKTSNATNSPCWQISAFVPQDGLDLEAKRALDHCHPPLADTGTCETIRII